MCRRPLEEQAAMAPALDFGDEEVPEATLTALRVMGFAEPARIVDAVARWQAGHVRAFRSERARALMNTMLPALLAALAAQPHPDATFARFDAFIGRQPAGVQLLSLFQRNPPLLQRVAAVLGAAPSLADYLAQHPAALEGLLSPQEDEAPVRLLRNRLHDARLLEDAIGIIRRTVKEVDFSLSVATMEGRLDADADGRTPQCTGRCRSRRAAAVGDGGFFHALWDGTWRGHGRDFARQGGRAGNDGRL